MPETTNYDWNIPEVGGDQDTWGDELNALFEEIDAQVFAVEAVADAALPLAGGVMTGAVKIKTAATAHSSLGSVSGATELDLTDAQSFAATITGATTFSFAGAIAGDYASGFVLKLTNPGAFVITWPASVRWPGGSPPTFTVAGIDTLVFLTFDNGTIWQAFVSGQDIK